MKIFVPPHDAEYNHQPNLGEPLRGTRIEFIADVENPRDVLRLVVVLNNMILDLIGIIYRIELAVLNKQGDAEILKLVKSRNNYHMN